MISDITKRMYGYDEVYQRAIRLNQEVQNRVRSCSQTYQDFITHIPNKPLKEGLDDVGAVITAVTNIFKTVKDGGVCLPEILTLFNVRKEYVDEIVLTVKSRLHAKYQIRKQDRIVVGPTFIQDIATAIGEIVFHLYYLEYAEHNIDVLNHRLKSAFDLNNVATLIQFQMDATQKDNIAYIDDNNIIFIADLDQALHLEEYDLGKSPISGYAQALYKESMDTLIKMVRTRRPIAKLLHAKHPLITELAGIPTRKKAAAIVKSSCHRKATSIRKEGGIGYFYERIDGIMVFSLLVQKQGKLHVLLKPFSEDTGDIVPIDCDVVAYVEKERGEGANDR